MPQPTSRRRSYSSLLFLLLVLLATWALTSGAVKLPDRWNPWAPLRLHEEPNVLTAFKLSRASADRDACRAVLAQSSMRLAPLEDRDTGEGCGFDNAFRVERSSIDVG